MTDVNDHRPSINIEALSPVEGRAATPEAAAVGSFVAHVIVSDADAGANGRTSCQLHGPDSDLFRLQSVSAVQVSLLAVAAQLMSVQDSERRRKRSVIPF